MPAQKKPRHRHTPAQLAALAELYEQCEHPTLQQRIDLGSRIGLETKSVNSYFQNKRASTKKQRPRAAVYISSSSDFPPSPQIGDSYPPVDAKPSFQPDVPNPPEFLSEPESIPQRLMHSSLDQVDDPQKSYALHGERQGIADSRCEIDTNWFPSPRTLSEEQKDAEPAPEDGNLSRPFPPAPDQPSLTERGRRPDIASLPDDGLVSRSRRTSSRRSTTPYSSTSAVVSLSARQRRARPEPLQLDALKQLYSKTATPSIEERSSLALEIGMEVGKVTNWFRNLRQSARKRAKKVGRRQGGNSDDDDMDYTDGYGTGSYSPSASASASRAGTPVTGRRAGRLPVPIHSSDEDEEDEEEPQEAVTPSPSQSPSPTSSPSHTRHLDFSVAAALHDAMIQMAKEERFKDLAADALLLLEFQATST
ncbi:homeodomain transcription factor [Mycena sanguinolenta]|nr:homeodomain transcription factor [Mycena sanguinolenta]